MKYIVVAIGIISLSTLAYSKQSGRKVFSKDFSEVSGSTLNLQGVDSMSKNLPTETNLEEADSRNSPSLTLSAGIAVPSGLSAFRLFWDSGVSVGVSYGLPLGSATQLIIGLDYNRFSFNSQLFVRSTGYDASNGFGAVSTTTLTASIKTALGKPHNTFVPFLLIGAGYLHFPSEKSFGFGEDYDYIYYTDPKNELMMQFSLGLDCSISDRICLLLQPTFAFTLTGGADTRYFPLRLGTRVGL